MVAVTGSNTEEKTSPRRTGGPNIMAPSAPNSSSAPTAAGIIPSSSRNRRVTKAMRRSSRGSTGSTPALYHHPVCAANQPGSVAGARDGDAIGVAADRITPANLEGGQVQLHDLPCLAADDE